MKAQEIFFGDPQQPTQLASQDREPRRITKQRAWSRHRARIWFLYLDNGQRDFAELWRLVCRRYRSVAGDEQLRARLFAEFCREQEGRRAFDEQMKARRANVAQRN